MQHCNAAVFETYIHCKPSQQFTPTRRVGKF